MFRTGQKLSTTDTAVNATTSAENQSGALGSACVSGTAMALQPRMIVSQFSQAKLPDNTSHSCVTITIAPATLAIGCGANSANGTTNWAKWLPATSTRCSGLGR